MIDVKRLFVCLTLALMLAGWPQAGSAQLFGSSKKDAETVARLNQMEENMRALTGQIEELNHQIRVLQDQIRRMQEDTEYRLQQLEGGAPRQRSDVAPGGAAPNAQGQGQASGGTLRGSEPQVLGTLSESYGPAGGSDVGGQGSGDAEFGAEGGYSGGSGPLDLSALARGLENPGSGVGAGDAGSGLPGVNGGEDPIGDQVAALEPSADPQAAYNAAYDAILSGDYRGAEAGFMRFLADYPDHNLAGNAQFWLGESYYAQGRYRDAADAFLKSYTDYPDGQKATDSLLKLGLSLEGIGERDAACATFSELLAKYPNAPVAVRSEAQAEQQRVGCS
ncbi:tol-pal system protein YbgF [Hongsoonwoonella zoysiae]|uniref:tol-pal system protein YbgF n=1 Tax=Hongsoonwoonella zoysiae TaxID=2821844 RepID=UPI001AED6A9C|nr:tol-pal system protein YbgF [Hongsoonwoonella zoysiae]